eukprot:scaffold5380_cov131-Cylindrotheca_fusiformis.AAC.5
MEGKEKRLYYTTLICPLDIGEKCSVCRPGGTHRTYILSKEELFTLSFGGNVHSKNTSYSLSTVWWKV